MPMLYSLGLTVFSKFILLLFACLILLLILFRIGRAYAEGRYEQRRPLQYSMGFIFGLWVLGGAFGIELINLELIATNLHPIFWIALWGCGWWAFLEGMSYYHDIVSKTPPTPKQNTALG